MYSSHYLLMLFLPGKHKYKKEYEMPNIFWNQLKRNEEEIIQFFSSKQQNVK